MRLKLCIAATIFAAAPIVAFAQDDNSNAEASKPTFETAQKLVESIRSDKDELKAYCELGRLHQQMEKAEKTNDTKGLDDLGTRSLIASNSELCPTTFGS
jgi:hypothetical protein